MQMQMAKNKIEENVPPLVLTFNLNNPIEFSIFSKILKYSTPIDRRVREFRLYTVVERDEKNLVGKIYSFTSFQIKASIFEIVERKRLLKLYSDIMEERLYKNESYFVFYARKRDFLKIRIAVRPSDKLKLMIEALRHDMSLQNYIRKKLGFSIIPESESNIDITKPHILLSLTKFEWEMLKMRAERNRSSVSRYLKKILGVDWLSINPHTHGYTYAKLIEESIAYKTLIDELLKQKLKEILGEFSLDLAFKELLKLAKIDEKLEKLERIEKIVYSLYKELGKLKNEIKVYGEEIGGG